MRWRTGDRNQLLDQGRRRAKQPLLADEFAFAVEFRAQGAPAEVQPVTPGLTRVVIFLDEEGTPGGYSIDGTAVES